MKKWGWIILFLASCGGMRPITVAPPSSPTLMAGQTIHNRLVAAQSEIRAAHDKKLKKNAQVALVATEAVWETYNANPTVDNWNQVQTIGSTLDAALRKLRGEQIGAPGTMPLCVTMKESWCRQPREFPQPAVFNQ